jgi:hypothetical protein
LFLGKPRPDGFVQSYLDAALLMLRDLVPALGETQLRKAHLEVAEWKVGGEAELSHPTSWQSLLVICVGAAEEVSKRENEVTAAILSVSVTLKRGSHRWQHAVRRPECIKRT